LIASSWGGTTVEACTPEEDLVKCNLDSYNNHSTTDQDPRFMPSVLYNAMIHPFTKMTINGVLWYQGEQISQMMALDLDSIVPDDVARNNVKLK
jgi:sialate O-acetylesterase